MHRESLAAHSSLPWAKLNNIELNGVKISGSPETLEISNSKGSGVFAMQNLSVDSAVLMTVPKELVLSHDNVWIYAKSDRHLREVLEAVGDYARTARGAILIFLLMQMTSNCSDIPIKVGTSNPWTEYIKFMPAKIPLPTFWNEAERKLLEGTSLKAALEAKLGSLDREFFDLREATRSIEWCMYWWDPDVGRLSFEDWKMVDAIYRSRALDLPGTGHAMVPCIDMANHASGDETVALYDTDSNGNAILVLRDGKNVMSGEEITITYGDEKGACEMVFSYGFLESDLPLPTDEETDLLPRALMAREMFLDIDIPDDDPLKLAKKSAFDAPPGFRLYDRDHDGSIEWEGLFVWLLCVNEEDGLEFHVLQCADGEKELKVSWQGQEIQGIQSLKQCLEKDPLQDVFRLRAVTTLLERIASQLGRLISNGDFVNHAISQVSATYKAWLAYRLAMLEEPFLLVAHQFFLKQQEELLTSTTIQAYLSQSPVERSCSPAFEDSEDFEEADNFA